MNGNSITCCSTTFYRRPLPDTCIAFGSLRGKELFQQALLEGLLQVYFPLAEQFITQAEPAYCGLCKISKIQYIIHND